VALKEMGVCFNAGAAGFAIAAFASGVDSRKSSFVI